MADKSLKVAVVLSAVDKMSRVVSAAVDKSSAKLLSLQMKSEKVASSAFRFGGQAALFGGVLAAPFIMATKKAIEFEDKMADVAKVMNLQVGGKELAKVSEDAKRLSIHLGESASNTAGLMASLAQGGVEKENLEKVSRIAGEMGVAFGMSADVAGDKFIKMKNALGTSIKDTQKVADAINFLADSTAAGADQIVTFMASGGSSVARTLKISGAAAAAFGSTLISIGKSGEESATIMEKFQKGIMENPKFMKMFTDAGGGTAGMLKILEDGSKLTGEAQFKYFSKFGQYGTAIAQMAQSFDFTSKTVASVANEQQYLNSVQKEFNNRAGTTKMKLDRAKAAFEAAAISAGNALLPILVELIKAITPIIQKISAWIQRNPKLVATIGKIIAIVAMAAIGISALSFVVGGLAKGFSFLMNVLRITTIVFRVLWAVISLNPFTILATIAIGAGLLIWKFWDKIKAFFKKLWEGIKWIFKSAFRFIKFLIWDMNPIVLIVRHWKKIPKFFSDMWEGVKTTFKNFFKWIAGIPRRMWEWGKKMAKAFWEGLKGIGQAIKDHFTGQVFENVNSNITKLMKKRYGMNVSVNQVNRAQQILADSFKKGNKISEKDALKMAVKESAGKNIKANPVKGGNTNINYAPTITMNGPVTNQDKTDFAKMLQQNKKEIHKIIKDEKSNKERKTF